MLKIYNTIAREKQDFTPIEAGRVRMYVCGMTVYDFCHLGHARVMVVFDMVTRWLRASDYASPMSGTSPTSTTRSSVAPRKTAKPCVR
jgi:cysteinyl-tRNA synthetase